jgi:hypothetical protein
VNKEGKASGMADTHFQNQSLPATEYLELIRSLTREVETAIHAISRNVLLDLEESILDQQVLSARLHMMRGEQSFTHDGNAASFRPCADRELEIQIIAATKVLQKQTREYAALLTHSSRSAALMVLLLRSFKNQFQEASGCGSQYQTWSCQM